MGPVPFCWAHVGHRLDRLVLGAQRLSQPFGVGTNVDVGGRQVRRNGWPVVLRHHIHPLAARGAGAAWLHSFRSQYPRAFGNQARASELFTEISPHDCNPGPIRCDSWTWSSATYEGEIARSDATIVIEGNHYFPAHDVDQGVLRASDNHTICSWKGQASYYDVVVGEYRNCDAAWFYPDAEGRRQRCDGSHRLLERDTGHRGMR